MLIIINSRKKAIEPIGGKTYEFLICQIWAILPSICNNATDVKENFKVCIIYIIYIQKYNLVLYNFFFRILLDY